MEKFIIAGVKTEYNVKGSLLRERSKPYAAHFDDGQADIVINLKDSFIDDCMVRYPNLTRPEHEYMWTGEAFYKNLIKMGGIMLHSSCVEKDGAAYLFSAKSGTGKSTHTHLWLKHLSNTRILNDDKPAIMYSEGRWLAYGTPFSGKTDENINTSAPVRAIIFIERGEKNCVKPMEKSEAVGKILSQTVRPFDKTSAEMMLETVDALLKEIPIFRLVCNMDDDAAETSYREIERLITNEN